jgi:hypothetical protein
MLEVGSAKSADASPADHMPSIPVTYDGIVGAWPSSSWMVTEPRNIVPVGVRIDVLGFIGAWPGSSWMVTEPRKFVPVGVRIISTCPCIFRRLMSRDIWSKLQCRRQVRQSPVNVGRALL